MTPPASPSPARAALQHNLTLTRKKSWFGSARQWTQHVKGYFETEPERGRRSFTDSDVQLTSPASVHEPAVAEPPMSPTRQQRVFTPRNAMASLRQHMHSSKDRYRRGTLDHLHDTTSVTQDTGETVTPTPGEDGTKGHGRKSSMAKSIVGSLRGLSKRNILNQACSPQKIVEQRESETSNGASDSPVIHSEPIAIPELSLDLSDDKTGLMALTEPSGQLPVPSYYFRLPGEGPEEGPVALPSLHASKTLSEALDYCLPCQARDTLCDLKHPCTLCLSNAAECLYSTVEPPIFQLDGTARDEPSPAIQNDKELFERNVEYRNGMKKENRKLKHMVSLDAVAEEVTHTSGSGVPAHLQDASAGHRDSETGAWMSDDPFAPGNALSDPLPKITVQQPDSTEPRTYNESEARFMPDIARYEFDSPDAVKAFGELELDEARVEAPELFGAHRRPSITMYELLTSQQPCPKPEQVGIANHDSISDTLRRQNHTIEAGNDPAKQSGDLGPMSATATPERQSKDSALCSAPPRPALKIKTELADRDSTISESALDDEVAGLYQSAMSGIGFDPFIDFTEEPATPEAPQPIEKNQRDDDEPDSTPASVLSPAFSPVEMEFWQNLTNGPFDTPPGQSLPGSPSRSLHRKDSPIMFHGTDAPERENQPEQELTPKQWRSTISGPETLVEAMKLIEKYNSNTDSV